MNRWTLFLLTAALRRSTTTELESAFERVGFGSVEYFGAYDPAVHPRATDRLVAVAQLSDVSFEHSAIS